MYRGGGGDPGALGHGRRMCKQERKENTDFSTSVIVVLGIVTERTYYMYSLPSSPPICPAYRFFSAATSIWTAEGSHKRRRNVRVEMNVLVWPHRT